MTVMKIVMRTSYCRSCSAYDIIKVMKRSEISSGISLSLVKMERWQSRETTAGCTTPCRGAEMQKRRIEWRTCPASMIPRSGRTLPTGAPLTNMTAKLTWRAATRNTCSDMLTSKHNMINYYYMQTIVHYRYFNPR